MPWFSICDVHTKCRCQLSVPSALIKFLPIATYCRYWIHNLAVLDLNPGRSLYFSRKLKSFDKGSYLFIYFSIESFSDINDYQSFLISGITASSTTTSCVLSLGNASGKSPSSLNSISRKSSWLSCSSSFNSSFTS